MRRCPGGDSPRFPGVAEAVVVAEGLRYLSRIHKVTGPFEAWIGYHPAEPEPYLRRKEPWQSVTRYFDR